MSSTPQFASTVKVGVATLSVADTSRTTPTNAQNVLAGGATGTRLRSTIIQATGTTTAGMVRLFLHDGTNFHLFYEQTINAATPSGTVKAESYALNEVTNPELFPQYLPSGWSLRATTNNAEGFKVIGGAGDF